MVTRPRSRIPKACRDALAENLQPELFKALCDPARVAMVSHLALAPEPLTVSEASTCCGVHISGVSRHLAILRRAGVVIAHKRGREVFYELNQTRLTSLLRGLADAIEACTEGRPCHSPRAAQG